MTAFVKTLLRSAFFVIESCLIFIRNFFRYKFSPSVNCRYTHNHYHFGDNALDVLYLVKLAIQNPEIHFFHYCKNIYIHDLQCYASNVKNLRIFDLKSRPYFSVNTWKNYHGRWERDPEKFNFVSFYLKHFERISQNMGLNCPIASSDDLVFDGDRFFDSKVVEVYDYLIVNSRPLSKQFDNDDTTLDDLARRLSKNYAVITTRKIDNIECTTDKNYSLYQIGCLSTMCRNLIMVSTGPSWYAINTKTIKSCKNIIILLKNERIEIPPVISSIESLNCNVEL